MTNITRLISEDTDPSLLSSVLADPCQREILRFLLDHSQPATDRDLAVQLATREGDTSPSDVAEDDVQRKLVELHHRLVPKLESIGWIDRIPEGIVTTEQFPSGEPESSLPPLRESDRQWDVLTALLTRPYRRHIVVTLARLEQPLTLDELANELAAHEQFPQTIPGDGEGKPPSLVVMLHHIDLPRLDEVGLVDYDADEMTITRDPVLASVAAWIDSHTS